MFEYREMMMHAARTAAAPGATATGAGETRAAATRGELQARIHALQSTKLHTGRQAAAQKPLAAGLTELLPEGLRAGVSYSLTGSTSLPLALMAEASRQGAWCGVLGMPELGTEAAAGLGIALGRLVLVPHPGSHWWSVAGTLVDVLGIVLAAPPARVTPAEASRLGARLRASGATLLVAGEWPQAEARLRAGEPRWEGLGEGHGALAARRIDVTVSGRDGRPRRSTLLLPATGDPHPAPLTIAGEAPKLAPSIRWQPRPRVDPAALETRTPPPLPALVG